MAQKKNVFELDQFLFNLELLIIKLYSLKETNKKELKNTIISKLRQAIAHKNTSIIFSGRDKITFLVDIVLIFCILKFKALDI